MIGVIDSGVGGLSVLKELRQAMPQADFFYLGDTARNPYGTRPPEEIKKYSLQLGKWLLAHEVTGLVVACNTITVQALDLLRHELPIPVIGMQTDVALLPAEKRVAVLATPATIAKGTYQQSLAERYPAVDVVTHACPGLASAIEHYRREEIEQLLEECRSLLSECDAAILGCTHYPLVLKDWQELAPACRFIDPAQATAKAARHALGEQSQGDGRTEYTFTQEGCAAMWVFRLFGPNATARQVTIEE